MGMVDTFVYQCGKCGKKTSSQTKLFIQFLSVFRKGGKIPSLDGKDTFKLRLKEKCEKCKSYNTVMVRKRKIIGFSTRATPNVIEKMWGEYSWRR